MNPHRPPVLAALLLLVAAVHVSALDAPEWGGLSQSRLDVAFLSADDSSGSALCEEYLNLRLKARAGERGTLYSALNLIASSDGGALTGTVELERLYARLSFGEADIECGLLRLASGWGRVWRPLDFLSPANPLVPEARPFGVLAAALFLYPGPESRLRFFASSGEGERDSGVLETVPRAALGGVCADVHFQKVSLLGLYAYEGSSSERSSGLHRLGASVKLDMAVGLVGEGLWCIDPEQKVTSGGFMGTLGLDASIQECDLYLLCEYLWNGPGALGRSGSLETIAEEDLGKLNRLDYFYLLLQWQADDWTALSADAVASLDDLSAIAGLRVERELWQGAAFTVSVRMPLDREVCGAGEAGELGPSATGSRLLSSVKLVLRF